MSSYLDKISKELLQMVSVFSVDNKVDCIVYAQNYRSLVTQAKSINTPFFELPFIKAIGIKLNSAQIFHLAKVTYVSFITKQAKVFAQVDVARKIANIDTKHNLNGKNVSIAVIDTGVNLHLDFCLCRNRIINFVDFINGKTTPYDDNGHGTVVTSVACGTGLVSGGKYKGFAHKANIVSLKALDKSGESGAYKILQAMQWVADNHRKYNIRVVCMSFGSEWSDSNDPLMIGAEALWSMGIVVVAAAGNSGPENSTIKSPGISPKIITVGALDDGRGEDGSFEKSNFKVAKFSSRGPAGYFYKPDILASGVNVVGASFDKEQSSFYQKMSGTSVATPIVAGACADIISLYPNITPDQLKVRLLSSCQVLSGNRNEEGFGYMDLNKLFN